MVRATVFVSALFALIATVAAVPRPLDSLVDADYVGTGDLNFDEAFQEVVDLRDLNVQGNILYTLTFFYIYSYFFRRRL
jgi:hypothetical protein